MDSKGIKHVDFLNLDIEGAELAALRGIDFPRHAPKVVCVEIHGVTDLQAISSEPVAQFLFDKGYVLFAATVINFFFINRDAMTPQALPTEERGT